MRQITTIEIKTIVIIDSDDNVDISDAIGNIEISVILNTVLKDIRIKEFNSYSPTVIDTTYI